MNSQDMLEDILGDDVSMSDISADEIATALNILRRCSKADLKEVDPALLAPIYIGYPELAQTYPTDFQVDSVYKAGLPDLQNGPSSLIRGVNQRIQHVGISNFRLPLRYPSCSGVQILETSVTGSVSLEADKKGINMSRIMRSFYKYAEDSFGFEVVDQVLDRYKSDLDSFDARIQLRFCLPIMVDSLRSGLSGYQYYHVALEVVERAGVRTRIMHLDYVYSSTCPCSLELSEHARKTRGQMATPHSQRSVARISVVLDPSAGNMTVDDLIVACRKAIVTETQVMVKREDEQAFAELNAANPVFVEDAARLFCDVLQDDDRIKDFRIVASHQESLHSHDAVSILTQGDTFANVSIDPHLFPSLIHIG